MIKDILTVSALVIFGAAAYAGEPMTRDAVVDAAKDGVEFVGNTYVQERKTENPDLILIDVRTEDEYELGHIPDAIWIPRGRVEFEVAEKVRDAETEIIVYCKTGMVCPRKSGPLFELVPASDMELRHGQEIYA